MFETYVEWKAPYGTFNPRQAYDDCTHTVGYMNLCEFIDFCTISRYVFSLLYIQPCNLVRIYLYVRIVVRKLNLGHTWSILEWCPLLSQYCTYDLLFPLFCARKKLVMVNEISTICKLDPTNMSYLKVIRHVWLMVILLDLCPDALIFIC